MKKLLILLLLINTSVLAFYVYPALTEPRLLALCFNHIGPADNEKYDWSISPQLFRQILDHLNKQGYKTVTSKQLADFVHGKGDIPENAVYLAFAGAATSQVQVAIPELMMRDYHGTFFLRVERDEKKEQLVGLSARKLMAGGEIQSHGRKQGEGFADITNNDVAYYQRLCYEKLDTMEKDVLQLSGKKPIALIHPDGNPYERAFYYLETRGYRVAFTGNSGFINRSCHHFELPMNYIDDDDGLERVLWLLKYRRDETKLYGAACFVLVVFCLLWLGFCSAPLGKKAVTEQKGE